MRAKKIDLDLINEHFELVAGELWKINSRTKKPLIGEKTFIMSEDGTKDIYKVNRLIYAMTNNVEEFDYLGSDDDGDLVPLPVNIISLLAHVSNDKTWLHKSKTRGYTARLTDGDGVRLSKTFESYSDALKWQRKQVDIIWGSELRKYNVYNRYFDAEPTERYDDTPMPRSSKLFPSNRKYWSDDETNMLRKLYTSGSPLVEITNELNSEFDTDRKIGGIQSKVFKLNRDEAM